MKTLRSPKAIETQLERGAKLIINRPQGRARLFRAGRKTYETTLTAALAVWEDYPDLYGERMKYIPHMGMPIYSSDISLQ